jgi:hypothetical protein
MPSAAAADELAKAMHRGRAFVRKQMQLVMQLRSRVKVGDQLCMAPIPNEGGDAHLSGVFCEQGWHSFRREFFTLVPCEFGV